MHVYSRFIILTIYFQRAFTDKAISITSYVYEADKQTKADLEKIIKSDKTADEDRNDAEQKLADHVSHAGRLLFNHGYLRDAINTENNAYLESDTVKKILNKILYGTEVVHRQSVRICIFYSKF